MKFLKLVLLSCCLIGCENKTPELPKDHLPHGPGFFSQGAKPDVEQQAVVNAEGPKEKLKDTAKKKSLVNFQNRLACESVDDCTQTTNNAAASTDNCCHGCVKHPVSKSFEKTLGGRCRLNSKPQPCPKLNCARQAMRTLICEDNKCQFKAR